MNGCVSGLSETVLLELLRGGQLLVAGEGGALCRPLLLLLVESGGEEGGLWRRGMGGCFCVADGLGYTGGA